MNYEAITCPDCGGKHPDGATFNPLRGPRGVWELPDGTYEQPCHLCDGRGEVAKYSTGVMHSLPKVEAIARIREAETAQASAPASPSPALDDSERPYTMDEFLAQMRAEYPLYVQHWHRTKWQELRAAERAAAGAEDPVVTAVPEADLKPEDAAAAEAGAEPERAPAPAAEDAVPAAGIDIDLAQFLSDKAPDDEKTPEA
jgi:hypothetical protein